MRWYLTVMAVLTLVTSVAVADDLPAEKAKKEDDNKLEEQASYGIGFQVGTNIAQTCRSQSISINLVALVKGLQDALAGKKCAYPEDELNNAVNEHRKQSLTKAAKKNKDDGEAFLMANAKKEGVKTLQSGLQYMVIKEGDGPSPGPTDRVKTHYHGTLIDGTVFDSSVDRGEPISFEVNGVIPGWTEALQLMKVGDKWRLFLPSKLAYGVQGAAPDIGPNCVLIFEVELLGIEP